MPNTENEVRQESGIKTEEGNRITRSNRGFAAMDQEQRREIASKGGKAAHEKGTAHEFTSEEARQAGYKGGQARQSR
jgi:general stress protein YciG